MISPGVFSGFSLSWRHPGPCSWPGNIHTFQRGDISITVGATITKWIGFSVVGFVEKVKRCWNIFLSGEYTTKWNSTWDYPLSQRKRSTNLWKVLWSSLCLLDGGEEWWKNTLNWKVSVHCVWKVISYGSPTRLKLLASRCVLKSIRNVQAAITVDIPGEVGGTQITPIWCSWRWTISTSKQWPTFIFKFQNIPICDVSSCSDGSPHHLNSRLEFNNLLMVSPRDTAPSFNWPFSPQTVPTKIYWPKKEKSLEV